MAHIIKNFEELAQDKQREDALSIAEAGYGAINVGNALKRKLLVEDDVLKIGDSTYNIADRRIFFVGVGKCAFVAASAIEEFLGSKLTSGIAFDVSTIGQNDLKKIETFVGTHPLPSDENAEATSRIIEFLSEKKEEDLIIMLISGGGSTLLCSPEAPMTPEDESSIFKELTAKGASIQEMNTVRKHTSRARGGGLARAAFPAEVLSLIVSDVPGNDIAFISSGPTVQDASTIADAEGILEKYNVSLPTGTSFINSTAEEKYFEKVTNILFLTNQDALTAMNDEANRLGYETEIVDDHFTGEARDIGETIIEKLHDESGRRAFLYAGESTVTLDTSSGKGGRNQEMALAALEEVRPGEIILPFASDGHDNTDHAGAIGDSLSAARAKILNLSAEDYLTEHRAYDFFSTTGDALITGYTGSNVSDLIVALKN